MEKNLAISNKEIDYYKSKFISASINKDKSSLTNINNTYYSSPLEKQLSLSSEEYKNYLLTNVNENTETNSKKTQLFHSELINNYEYFSENIQKQLNTNLSHSFNQLSFLDSSISSRFSGLINNQNKSNLYYSNNEVNENLSFNIFKTLENGQDLHVFSDDLYVRNVIMDGYLLHICNYLLISREKNYIHLLLNKISNLNMENTHEIVNQELFLNKDIEELKKYYINFKNNKHPFSKVVKQKNENIKIVENEEIINQLYNNKFVIETYYVKEAIEILEPLKDKILELNYNDDSKIFLEKKEKIQELNKEIIKLLHSKKDLIEDFSKDLGFTRPRIIILLPLKKHCFLILKKIVNIISEKGWNGGIGKKKKFLEEYSEENQLEDYFMMGMGIEIRSSNNRSSNVNNFDANTCQFDKHIELFTPFNESDIIIASPIALKQSKIEKKYFSSIEILLMDFSETFLYQNLEYLETLSEDINLFPLSSSDLNDIYRIKDNYKEEEVNINKVLLNNKSNTLNSNTSTMKKYNLLKNLRQSIFVSNIKSLELESIFQLYSGFNPSGKVIIKRKPLGVMKDIITKSDIEVNDCNSNKNTNEGNANNSKISKQSSNNFYCIKFEFKLLTISNFNECHETKFNFFIKNVR